MVPLERPPPRLVELPESFVDTLDPSVVQQVETVGKSLQDWVNAVVTQIRRIMGTTDWKDDPQTLALSLVQLAIGLDEKCFFAAIVDSTTQPGDWVRTHSLDESGYGSMPYGQGPFGTGPGGVTDRYVIPVTPTTLITYPAEGVVVSKQSENVARVQYLGIVKDVYTNLTFGRAYYLDKDGNITANISDTELGPYAHQVGIGCGNSALLLRFDTFRRDDVFRWDVALTGAKDGINDTFVIPNSERARYDPPQVRPIVKYNGQPQKEGRDYNLLESFPGQGFTQVQMTRCKPVRDGDDLDIDFEVLLP